MTRSRRLATQTNAGHVVPVSRWLAGRWAPAWARAWRIVGLTHTDYHGVPTGSDTETGYASFTVEYASRTMPGWARAGDWPTDYPVTLPMR